MKKNNVLKNISMALVIAGIVTTNIAIPVNAQTNKALNVNRINDDVIVPYDMSVASGSYSGTEFQAKYSLKSKNGSKVNFWISNNGNVDVKITINGSNARTLSPGENGHISASVGYFSSDYEFKAVPTPNGGNIKIDYNIAQRE